MNIPKDIIDSALRFSFSHFNTEQEIDYVIETLKKEVEILLRIMNRR
jgi:cysteine sulfinate desulfinase/cysteine desulfurase-like protein